MAHSRLAAWLPSAPAGYKAAPLRRAFPVSSMGLIAGMRPLQERWCSYCMRSRVRTCFSSGSIHISQVVALKNKGCLSSLGRRDQLDMYDCTKMLRQQENVLQASLGPPCGLETLKRKRFLRYFHSWMWLDRFPRNKNPTTACPIVKSSGNGVIFGPHLN